MKIALRLSVPAALIALSLPPARAVPPMADLSGAFAGLKQDAAPGQAALARAQELKRELAADPVAFFDKYGPEELSLVYGTAPKRLEDGERDPKRLLDPIRRLRPEQPGDARRLLDLEGAELKIAVSIARQTITIQAPHGTWTFPISSGIPGHRTPSGYCADVDFLDADHHSSLYGNAPMPHAVFFNGNIAIHGTYAENALGAPASHGCVRVSRKVAQWIYALVKRAGPGNARICVR